MRKYYEESVLLSQVWVHDQDLTVAKAVEKVAKELGTPIEVDGFVRFAVGEGIEKGDGGDFAGEVKAMAGR
jgi:elongation factor Ts